MLTADLVRARVRAGRLEVFALRGPARQQAEQLAQRLLDQAHSAVGARYEDLRSLWDDVPLAPKDAKLGAGLCKLIEDGAEFETDAELDPVAIRQEVFELAARQRREHGSIARDQVLEQCAAAHSVPPERLERCLFCDLRSEQRVLSVPSWSASGLLEHYEQSQLQAVLLRAVRVTVDIAGARPEGYRQLLRALKFRRLLFKASRRDDGYRLEIDGPYSLFDAVTKYGLQMALVLPVLMATGACRIEAELRWGKTRAPLGFALETDGPRPGDSVGPSGTAPLQPEPREEVSVLLAAFRSGRGGWTARAADHLIELPEGRVIVPDLVFRHASGVEVFLEVMGYWSRDALWQRIEAAQAGLPVPVLFAASSRLRVSEEALDDGATGSLYIFKGTPVVRAVEQKLEGLRARLTPSGSAID